MSLLKKLGRTDGVEILEAALVLPLVFMFLLGIVWFGRAFNIYATMTQAAEQGALMAARSTCATCGSTPVPDGTVTDCKSAAPPSVASTIRAVMCASSIDPTQIPVHSNPPAPSFCPNPPNTCTTASNITICRNAVLNPPPSTTEPAQCGVIVSFQYPFQFNVPFTSLGNKILLTGQAQVRMEN